MRVMAGESICTPGKGGTLAPSSIQRQNVQIKNAGSTEFVKGITNGHQTQTCKQQLNAEVYNHSSEH